MFGVFRRSYGIFRESLNVLAHDKEILIFPFLYLAEPHMDGTLFAVLVRFTFLGLAFLFVLKMRIPKPRGVFYLLFPLLALVLTVLWLGRM